MNKKMEFTKLSSKGQVVIPGTIRNKMGLSEGDAFAVVGDKDTLLLKRIKIPSRKELFKKFKLK
ncbi:MAG: AbrB/MazE/SpoVT family DNA-binding domain-containing protein [Candidatus Diapherotrites archaeon]